MNKKIKIAHDYDQLEDQIILTLKDKPILVNGHIDQDEDVLQNDQVQQVNQARYNSELKSKLKNIADASSSHLQAKNEGISEMLPHYNDYSFKPNTIEMQEGGSIKFKKSKKKRALGEDYEQSNVTTSKLNAEYASKQKRSEDRKSSSKQLLNFLEQTAEDDEPTFKRQLQADDIINASLDVLRKKRYTQNQIKSISREAHLVDEQQSILMKSIQNSRKKAEKSNRFDLLAAIKQEQPQQERDKKMVQIELNPISYKSSQAARTVKNVEVRQALSGTASVIHMHLPSQRLSKIKQEEELPQSFKEVTQQELQRMRDQVKFLEDKELGIGLAGTLSYLRQNSLLGKEQQVGRYNDKSVDYNDPNDRIKLQYRNASGKLMKPKQAYRYICAKFHGEGPGKNKVQMRKKRQLQQIRAKEMQNSGGQLLQLLQKHQTKSGQAHMVLNMGGKAAK